MKGIFKKLNEMTAAGFICLIAASCVTEVAAVSGSFELYSWATERKESVQLIEEADAAELSGNSFFSEELAAEYVREQFASREETVTFYYRTEDAAETGSVADDVLAEAFSYTGEPQEGDYMYKNMVSCSYSFNASSVVDGWYVVEVTYTPTWKTTAEQEAAVDAATDTILEDLAFTGEERDVVIAYEIYEYIAENYTYDDENLEDEEDTLHRTAYGAVARGRMTCLGFSELYYVLANKAGLECRIVASETHAWDLVCVDGEWYYCDVTWDAGSSGGYLYFLGGEEGFSQSHDTVLDTYGIEVSETSCSDVLWTLIVDNESVPLQVEVIDNACGTVDESKYDLTLITEATGYVHVLVEGKDEFEGQTLESWVSP